MLCCVGGWIHEPFQPRSIFSYTDTARVIFCFGIRHGSTGRVPVQFQGFVGFSWTRITENRMERFQTQLHIKGTVIHGPDFKVLLFKLGKQNVSDVTNPLSFLFPCPFISVFAWSPTPSFPKHFLPNCFPHRCH